MFIEDWRVCLDVIGLIHSLMRFHGLQSDLYDRASGIDRRLYHVEIK